MSKIGTYILERFEEAEEDLLLIENEELEYVSTND